jgi:hypothetical protein
MVSLIGHLDTSFRTGLTRVYLGRLIVLSPCGGRWILEDPQLVVKQDIILTLGSWVEVRQFTRITKTRSASDG